MQSASPSQPDHLETLRFRVVPEVVLFYSPNSVHLVDVASHVDELDPHVRARLDDAVLVVGVLRRGRVGLPSDVARDQLVRMLATAPGRQVSLLAIPGLM